MADSETDEGKQKENNTPPVYIRIETQNRKAKHGKGRQANAGPIEASCAPNSLVETI